MRWALFVLAAIAPQAALAQVSYPPPSPTVAASANQAATDAMAAKATADQAKATADAIAAVMPQPAVAAPKSEAVGAATGTTVRYAREDHQHPRLTSTTYATLDASGQATATFSRSFVNKPGLNLTETDAATGSQPLVLRGLAWQRDGNGLYIGVTIQGRRAQMLPQVNPLSGAITLVTGVVTGVNSLITSLTNYDVFGGGTAGATVSVIAIARSDVASN